MILLIDNYDSFSYNLFQMLGALHSDILVIRNDEKTLEELQQMPIEAIVLSPGPGRPAQAGICKEVVLHYTGLVPILGVCLGHQVICQSYGATVSYARQLMHGKQSAIKLMPSCVLFTGLPEEMEVARYHSLAVVPETLNQTDLEPIAWTAEGEVMAVRHKRQLVFGVQFHPESVLTPLGNTILINFLKLVSKSTRSGG